MHKEKTVTFGQWIRRHEWAVVSVLTVITFVMGCVGYYHVMHFEDQGGDFTYWDIFYSAFKLFIFDAQDATPGWPLYLQVARIIAPFLLIYAAVKAIWLQVGEHVALATLRFKSNPLIVVIGIGETGYRLAREYLQTSACDVVIIDQNRYNPLVAELKSLGAIVVFGNAIDPAMLARARVHLARDIFVFTGDEHTNIIIAKHIHRQVRDLRRSGKRSKATATGAASPSSPQPSRLPAGYSGIRCHIEVDSPELYELFQDHPFFNLIEDHFKVKIFNRREGVARNIFNLCAPDLYYRPQSPEDHPINVLFLGFSPLIQELLLQLALTAHYADLRRPHASVICNDENRAEVESFYHRYPNIEKVVALQFAYKNPMGLLPDDWIKLQSEQHFHICYSALNEDVDSILVAKRLNRLQTFASLPTLNFVVCLNQQTWIADVIDDDFVPITRDKRALPASKPIEFFETLDSTITIDIVVNDSLDTLARAIHDSYVASQREAGLDFSDNQSIIPWEDLPPHKRLANQRAAAHLDVKLRVAGMARTSMSTTAVPRPLPASKQEIEILSKIEHRRWMADKLLCGYVYGPKRDDARMLHPDLKPWEELSEADREKDRHNIHQIPALLAMLGETVIRTDDREEDTEQEFTDVAQVT
ncbi:NAD-binding protein [Microbulbifer sp. SA54]|uniref:NAD-binding protein n=1 Tax=Microbulbifer sp. SA54 TaxID=3401577 RepID=UPI003AAE14DB